MYAIGKEGSQRKDAHADSHRYPMKIAMTHALCNMSGEQRQKFM